MPLPAGTGDAGYMATLERIVFPIARQFAPDLIVVSNGLDASRSDPLGRMVITAGGYRRMTRATMLEVLEQNYIRTARAYGIAERMIVYRYALKNAISPTLTVIGLTLAYSLTGAFYVEIIFNWPGLGLFTARSFLNLDFPAIMGMTLFGASGYVFINLAVDLMQAWIDPRIVLE